VNKFIESFHKLCSQNPDIRKYVFFDEKERLSSKGEQIKILHEAFVAIQQLAKNIGEALGAGPLLNVEIDGPHDQYVFRPIGEGPPWVYGVFAANPNVDLVKLIARIHDQAIEALRKSPEPTNIPEPAPAIRAPNGLLDASNTMGPVPTATPPDGQDLKENKGEEQLMIYRGTRVSKARK
jgi:hypothetical protein